ncbi:MAG: PAS domain S-box protein [Dehalococcoidia bacterium]|nr:PAS domain S-box protein [Dehalococcoidia bacterium]
MFSLRSARGRAILAGGVLVILLAGVATLAVWGTRAIQQQHHAFVHTSAAAGALESAHVQFRREQAALLSFLLFSGDSSLLDDYHDAAAAIEQHLSHARAEALAEDQADEVLAIEDLTERMGQFNEQVDSALPLLLAADPETRLQLATAGRSEMWSEAEAIVADLQEMADNKQQELAASQAAADRAAATNLWLLIGYSAAAFVVAAGTIATLIVSVVRPLVSLRASARAISSGDLKARAKVSGTEEVASLAHDFNEMAETLAAKTQEYIDTTNLTGDIICRMDKHGMWTFLNDAACQFYGKPREELLGTDSRVFVHPDDLEATAQDIRKTRESKQPTGGLVNRQITPMGTRVVEWNGYPFFDEKGQYTGTQITGRDITERKQMEEALRRQEYELAERAKELNCLYGISVLVDKPGISLQEILQGTADLIPASWQYPQVTCARIIVDGQEFRTANFKETAWRQASNITVSDQRVGSVEVYYLDKRPESDEGPFLKKERTLINAVGERLGHITERKRTQEALRESEARYRLLAENTSDAIWTMDLGLKYTYMSPAITRMRGYTPEEVMGLSAADTMTPASLEVAMKSLTEQIAKERVRGTDPDRVTPVELEMYCKDGSTIWTEMTTVFLRGSDGKPVGILGVTRDISERKRAETALRESESKYRTLLENLPQKIFSKDKNSVYISCNDTYARDLNIKPGEIAGKTDYDFYPKELAEKYRADDKRIMQSGKTEDIEERYLQDGQEAFVHTVKTPVRDEDGNVVGILGIFWDITDRKRLEEERERLHAELEERAITDSLTGLYNHAHFFQRLAEEIERSRRYKRRFAVVMMDVDAFKHYNDSRGHQAGDDALRLIADSIRTGIRGSDIAFRYGGDEFAAILLNADSARAQTVVNRINKHIASGLKRMGDQAASWLGLSAGVASFPEDATTADDLVKVADDALYDAKRIAQARTAIEQAQAAGPLTYPSEVLDQEPPGVLSVAAEELAATLQELRVPDALSDLDMRTVAAVATAAEIKDRYIRGHQQRASRWAVALAEEMGLSPEQVQDIRVAGLLHDLGKVGISESILNKPGKLTEEEFAKIKEHPALGAMMIISEVESLRRLVPIVRHHHERFDGTGYPDGLAGEEIPLEARIMSVVDVFDAMTHERSYRKALSREEAIAELERGAGTQFDPAVVKAFLALLEKRGDEPAAPAQAASADRRLAAAKVAAPRRG